MGRKTPTLLIFAALSFKILCLILSPPVLAAEKNFSSQYNVSYTVNRSGLTKVRQEVTITNLTSKFYVSTYSFTVGSGEIRKIRAWDPTGPLSPKVVKKEEETVITVNFRARVFGEGKKMRFGISYDFPGLANKEGLIWTINLLRITGLKKTERYRLTLIIPKGFGELVYSHPLPEKVVTQNSQQIISYNKRELLLGPPRLAFGQFQLYQLSLTYHLENTSLGLGYTEIALPPDIPSQQQTITTNLFPKPVSIRIDSDGNYLARYNLGPKEKKEVVWEGLVALFYYPRVFTDQKVEALPRELVERYTKEDKYWEVKDKALAAQAERLFNSKLTAVENAKKVFEFVINYLSYDYSKLTTGDLTRLGAAAVFQENNKAICMEFTDLFITLSRAVGIPARELNGFAYTADNSNRPLSLRLQGGDILHAWPEIYLPDSGWVMVDPTWSSTSGSDYFSVFDLAHIAFVRKGISSSYPLPAGSYKTGPRQRDVKVLFSKDVSALKNLPQLSVEVTFPLLSISPFPTTALIKIQNTSNVASFETELFLTSNLLGIGEEEPLSLGIVPPGGTVETKVKLTPESFYTKGRQKLSVDLWAASFSGEKVTAFTEGETTVHPLYFPLPPLYLLTLVTGAFAFAYLGRSLTKSIRS